MNVIYLISCTNCNEQYAGSAIDFKKRFRIHRSDINTKKDRCGVARHFNNKCREPQNLVFFKNTTNRTSWCKGGEHASMIPFGTEKNIGKPYCLPTLTG